MKPTKIIIQDPDPDIRAIVKIALEQEDYVVLTFSDQKKVLDTIGDFLPEVVILDFRFRGQECVETCHKLKLMYPELPVIAFSCNSDIDEVYAKKGFDDYIAKPFDIDHLYDVLKKNLMN